MIACALFLGLSVQARTVHYSFKHLDVNDGLSSSTIKIILQDSNNFIWFGTKNGLNRYDGYRIVSYNCYDSIAQRGNNNIGALYEDIDGKLWVGTDRGIYVYDPVSETFTYKNSKTPQGEEADNWVQDIYGDGRGNVWALLPGRGVYRFYGDDEVEHYTVTDNVTDKDNTAVSMIVTSLGDVLVGTVGDGVYFYDSENNRFLLATPLAGISDEVTMVMRQMFDGRIALISQTGELHIFDTKLGTISDVPFSLAGKTHVRSMLCVDNEIWIGLHDGIVVINLLDGKETILKEQPDNPNGLSNNSVSALYSDRQGNIWIGTIFGGVDYFQRNGFKFDVYVNGMSPNSLSSKRVRGLAEDSQGRIYIGTEDAGFNAFDSHTGRFTRLSGNDVSLIIKSYGDSVFLGKSRGGLDMYSNGRFVGNNFRRLHGKDHNSVYSFLIDNHGNRWVGSDWGLYKANFGSNDYNLVPELSQDWVFDIMQDSKGLIWIATMGNGIFRYNPIDEQFKHYPYDEKASNGLKTNSISAIMEDSNGNIWISTDRGGLVKYNASEDNFISYSVEEGLPGNVVYDILEDARGYLWFGTNKGLVKFNPKDGAVKVFTTRDGLLTNEFNYHAALASSNGYFYFGSLNGVVAFNPNIDTYTESVPKLYFTGLKVGSKEAVVGAEDSPLKESIFYTECLEFDHDFPGMVLDFSAPAYTPQGKLEFSYRLSPIDTAWIPLNDHSVSLSQLSPGKYKLEVKVENGDVYTTKSITIRVLPPWYESRWAISVYVLLLAALIVVVVRYYHRIEVEKLQEKQKLFSINKEKELYENKVQFFAEIAHEIRTPLSLIDAPLEALEEMEIKEPRTAQYLKVMRQNTRRLLNLTGQLLDFQKIGANKFTFTFETVDVTSVVNETLSRFEPAMTVKGKMLTSDIPDAQIFAVTDREALTKILSNLFNNALKYSNREIDIVLSADAEQFSVSVTTDGKRISDEDALKIFEPFYQIDSNQDNNGVGIGLPLCRTIAHLLNGEVKLIRPDAEHNTFILTLPLHQEGITAQPDESPNISIPDAVIQTDESGTQDEAGYSILLVEDNDEMRDFLTDQLSQTFIVESCENGREALEKLQYQNFDIIVTDIMMPEMDGYELCKAVKEDINRSHIPVVFLTAKNDLESKLAALRCGGEAFIEKPFSIKFFRQQVLSLLENRKHERKAFLKQPFFSVDNMKMTKADEEFMNKVIKIITDNIADENFNVEQMADTFCMSRSSLLRKIKTLFNLSPIELIRIIKLKKAAELIQDGKYRIGDVCYMVGINSSSYFSKLFFKQFGVTPKGFEKQCRKNSSEAGEQSLDKNEN